MCHCNQMGVQSFQMNTLRLTSVSNMLHILLRFYSILFCLVFPCLFFLFHFLFPFALDIFISFGDPRAWHTDTFSSQYQNTMAMNEDTVRFILSKQIHSEKTRLTPNAHIGYSVPFYICFSSSSAIRFSLLLFFFIIFRLFYSFTSFFVHIPIILYIPTAFRTKSNPYFS